MDEVSTIKMYDAAALVQMGFTRNAAYKLLHDPQFPTVRIGRRLFVRSDKLITYLEAQEARADDAKD